MSPSETGGPLAPPFLGQLADTAPLIERLRGEHAAVVAARAALDAQANDLEAKIAAWNTLRQAHGQGPL